MTDSQATNVEDLYLRTDREVLSSPSSRCSNIHRMGLHEIHTRASILLRVQSSTFHHILLSLPHLYSLLKSDSPAPPILQPHSQLAAQECTLLISVHQPASPPKDHYDLQMILKTLQSTIQIFRILEILLDKSTKRLFLFHSSACLLKIRQIIHMMR